MNDFIVIGAGQAGLASGYHLKEKGVKFVILDANANIGDAWRKRYDSLVLFTLKQYDSLPGAVFPGHPRDLPGKNEVADYLQQYAVNFKLPLKTNCQVKELSRQEDHFKLLTSQGTMVAKQVIVATGPFQRPYIPDIHQQVSPDVVQLHSSEYLNPGVLR